MSKRIFRRRDGLELPAQHDRGAVNPQSGLARPLPLPPEARYPTHTPEPCLDHPATWSEAGASGLARGLCALLAILESLSAGAIGLRNFPGELPAMRRLAAGLEREAWKQSARTPPT